MGIGLVAALSLLTGIGGYAEVRTTYSFARASETPRAMLAQSLLGRERANDVVAVEVLDLGLIRQLSAIRFAHRPAPLGRDFCRQRTHLVSFVVDRPIDSQVHPELAELRADRVIEAETVALAPGCRLAPDQQFVRANPGIGIEAIMTALQDLATVQRIARRNGTLSFALSCVDETGRNACAPDPRATLGSLRLAQAWLMNSEGLVIGVPGQAFWLVTISGLGSDRATVSLTRRIPAPF